MYFKVSVKRVLQPFVYALQLLKHTRSYNTPNTILIMQHKEILQLCNYAYFILGLPVMTICTGRHRIHCVRIPCICYIEHTYSTAVYKTKEGHLMHLPSHMLRVCMHMADRRDT